MPKRYGKPFSKKIKRRKPIRDAFFNEFVKDNETILSVRFSHIDEKDTLLVTVEPTYVGVLPDKYEGYPVLIRDTSTEK